MKCLASTIAMRLQYICPSRNAIIGCIIALLPHSLLLPFYTWHNLNGKHCTQLILFQHCLYWVVPQCFNHVSNAFEPAGKYPNFTLALTFNRQCFLVFQVKLEDIMPWMRCWKSVTYQPTGKTAFSHPISCETAHKCHNAVTVLSQSL